MIAIRLVADVHLCVSTRLAKGADEAYGPQETGVRISNLSGLLTAYAVIDKGLLGSQRRTKYSFGMWNTLPDGGKILSDLKCYTKLLTNEGNSQRKLTRVAFPLLGKEFDERLKAFPYRNEFDCLVLLLGLRFKSQLNGMGLRDCKITIPGPVESCPKYLEGIV